MYAVIETGGRQYRIEKDKEFLVNRLEGKPSGIVKFKNVLFAKERNSFHIGTPYIKNAYVACEIISHSRGKKVTAFKYKRRKSQRTKKGHRQDLTKLKVKEIKI